MVTRVTCTCGPRFCDASSGCRSELARVAHTGWDEGKDVVCSTECIRAGCSIEHTSACFFSSFTRCHTGPDRFLDRTDPILSWSCHKRAEDSGLC